MLEQISCSTDPLILDGGAPEPICWGDERRFGPVVATHVCKGCGPSGGIHHRG